MLRELFSAIQWEVVSDLDGTSYDSILVQGIALPTSSALTVLILVMAW